MSALLLLALGCSRDTQLADFDGDGAFVNFDCNDRDPRISPFLEEVSGDGLDNDCDPETPDVVVEPEDTAAPPDGDDDGVPTFEDCDDEDPTLGAAPRWYPDCDGDGFAAEGALELEACETPIPVGTCVWVGLEPVDAPRVPANATTDCDDGDSRIHPSQTAFFDAAVEGAPVAYAWDFDCDGALTQEFGATLVCTEDPLDPDVCGIAAPAFLSNTSCGVVGHLVDACVPGPGGCVASGEGFATQRCR